MTHANDVTAAPARAPRSAAPTAWRALLAGALLAGASACAEPDDSCQDQTDCFRDQYCVEGTCQDDPPVTIENNGSNASSNNSSVANSGLGNNSSVANSGLGNNTSSNNATGNNGSTNNTSVNNTSTTNSTGNNSAGNTSTGPACLETAPGCDEDEYEEPGDIAHQLKPEEWSRVGCKALSDEEIIGLDRTLEGTVCEWDHDGDAYYIEYTRCRDHAIAIDITVQLDAALCPLDNFEVRIGADCVGVERCVEDHDPALGRWHYTVIIDPVSTVVPSNTVPLYIEPSTRGAEFDYVISARVVTADNL